MGITELLTQLANPETIHTLPLVANILSGLIVTMLGMGITFISLIALQVIISLLARFTAPSAGQAALQPPAPTVAAGREADAAGGDDELVAVITAAIAMYPSLAQKNIVIRNIRRIENQVPAWNRAGMLDQMNSRF